MLSGMRNVPFDVNDSNLRESFLTRVLADAVDDLTGETPSLWGNMSPQHMLEHLTWAFQCSTGIIELPCYTPGPILERTKRFLYDNRPTPHLFKNPALGENPPALLFRDFADSKAALRQELARFLNHFREQPGAMHVHPVFGPLGAEEWHRSHFKHCYHHLLQFGLIG